uniref:Uncharacterized protein n=2 Tax=Brassica oleracea TaxID=3712 RepID=A0A0D3A6R6_BRAOL|nr:unnamed protein product [Brassica oleracea]
MGGTCHPLAGSTSAPDSIVHEFSQKAFRKDATFVDLICLNLPPCILLQLRCLLVRFHFKGSLFLPPRQLEIKLQLMQTNQVLTHNPPKVREEEELSMDDLVKLVAEKEELLSEKEEEIKQMLWIEQDVMLKTPRSMPYRILQRAFWMSRIILEELLRLSRKAFQSLTLRKKIWLERLHS